MRPAVAPLLLLTLAATALAGAELPMSGGGNRDDEWRARQQRLLEIIEGDFRETASLTGVRAMSEPVHAAMAAVPRHAFVDPEDRARAYVNRPLTIGHGQTISQPFIVALMTELAAVGPASRVLEIGTGSGYQAAVLGEIVHEVYTIEIIEPLARRAERVLREQGYDNVHVKVGDGKDGWPEAAPFDAIVVTAAGALPPALLDQLAPGGRIVIPIEHAFDRQELTVVTVAADGGVEQRSVLPVRFVPLVDD
jgi:protein-L-isoaspartate(D-aspartate) O-methyltransferase